MADTAAPVLIHITTEDDLQVAYFTIAAVANNTTTDFSKQWTKAITFVDASPSTAVAVGSTTSAGVVTWLISSGTPNLVVRLAFQ